MFLGKLFICAANGAVCFLIVTNWKEVSQKINSPYVPCAIAVIIGYVIGACFMSIFSFASDAIMQSFLLDESMGAAGKGRPESNRPKRMNEFVADAEKAKSGGCC